jgi:uncharacterized protein (DUF433 family)
MSKVISVRLEDEQIERLERAARELGRSTTESAALLLEESLREREFPHVEFRDSAVGRQAYIKETRVTVWQAVWIAQDYGGDVAKVAEHLGLPPTQVQDALDYAAAHPAEITEAIAAYHRAADHLRELLPNLQEFHYREAAS